MKRYKLQVESFDGHGSENVCKQAIHDLDGWLFEAESDCLAHEYAESLLDDWVKKFMTKYIGPRNTEPTGIGGLVACAVEI